MAFHSLPCPGRRSLYGIVDQIVHHVGVIASKSDENRVIFRKNLGKRLLPPFIQLLKIGIFTFWVK